MKYFKNLLMCVGAVCAVASTGSVYAGKEITGCRAVLTGGKTVTVSGVPPLPRATATNYYDVYCGKSRATSAKDAAKEINAEVKSQINTKAERGWRLIDTEINTYEKSKSACKKEFDSLSRKFKDEKHYNYCY